VDELISLQVLDRYDESRRLLAEVRAESEDRRDLSKAPGIAFAQMWHDYCLGLLDDAEADAGTLSQLCVDFQVPNYQLEARIILSRIAQLRGELPAARAHLAEAENAEGSDESRLLMLQLMAAWIAESNDDRVAALASVRDIVQRARRVRHRWLWQPAWLVAATTRGSPTRPPRSRECSPNATPEWRRLPVLRRKWMVSFTITFNPYVER